jgi:hypothetical protein
MFSDLAIIFGILIAALIGYYCTSNTFVYLEAMTDPEKQKKGSSTDVATTAQSMSDATKTALTNLNIKENRAHYNTMNDQLEQWISVKMVEGAKNISDKIGAGGASADMAEISKMMADLNALKSFKVALDDSAKFIDTH